MRGIKCGTHAESQQNTKHLNNNWNLNNNCEMRMLVISMQSLLAEFLASFAIFSGQTTFLLNNGLFLQVICASAVE